jgi:hypothetical protein
MPQHILARRGFVTSINLLRMIAHCKMPAASCVANAMRETLRASEFDLQFLFHGVGAAIANNSVVDIIWNVVSNVGSESWTWRGSEGKPRLIGMSWLRAPVRTGLTASLRCTHDRHISAKRRGSFEKLWCIPEKSPTTEAMLSHIDQRKFRSTCFA